MILPIDVDGFGARSFDPRAVVSAQGTRTGSVVRLVRVPIEAPQRLLAGHQDHECNWNSSAAEQQAPNKSAASIEFERHVDAEQCAQSQTNGRRKKEPL